MSVILKEEICYAKGFKRNLGVWYSSDKSFSARWVDIPSEDGRYTGKMGIELSTSKGTYLFDNYDSGSATTSRSIGEYITTISIDYDGHFVLSW